MDNINIEQWLPIEGFEGRYFISSIGRVRSTSPSARNRFKESILKPRIHNGYYRVALQLNGVRKEESVHRIVASSFISNPDLLPQVNHIDGNKLNNNHLNLEWVTAKNNILHANKLNLIKHAKGSSHSQAKLNDIDVIDIRLRFNNGETQHSISLIYDISITTVHQIVRRKTWTHI